jgi:hypothetical protein
LSNRGLKIGILTFSRSVNYGAFLQCFSLFKQIEKITNDVTIINYSLVQAELGFFVQSLLRGMKRGLEQYFIIKRFGNEKLKVSRRFISSNYEKSVDFINSLNFDLIIAGSDEIWKINRFRSYPNVYWTSKALQAKKISYGASANRTYTKKLSPEVIQSIKAELDHYQYLGVRDQQTLDLLQEFSLGHKVHLNCDPTFTYEFQETPLLKEKLASKYHLDLAKPMIGLLSKNKAVGKAVHDHFGREFQIVAITCNNPYADFWLHDLDPFEWANVFSYFSGCVTSYFHGVIFSILNNTPFVAFDSEEYSLHYRTKLFDITQRTGLEGCYLNILKESEVIIPVRLSENMAGRDALIARFKDVKAFEREKWQSFVQEYQKLIKKV